MSLPRDLWLYAGAECLARYGTICRRTWPADRHGEDYKETFTRASSKTVIGLDGLLHGVGNNIIAVEYAGGGLVDAFGNPLSMVLLEATRTNLIENGDAETDAVGWVANASAIARTSATPAAFGSWSIDVTTTNIIGSGTYWTKRDTTRIAATAANAYTVSVWVKKTSGGGVTLQLQLQWYNAGGGVISTVQGTAFNVPGDNIWRRFQFTATAPANTVTVLPGMFTDVAQGAFDFWADVPQLESGAFMSSTIPTTTGPVTRSADSLFFPWPAQPQAGWFYLKFIERGTNLQSGSSFGVLSLSDGPGNAPELQILNAGAPAYRISHQEPAAGVVSTLGQGTNYGEIVELLGLVNADGSVKLSQSRNGGADVVTTVSAANAFAVAWSAPTLWFNSLGTGSTGFLGLIAAKGGPSVAISTIALARTMGGP